MAEELFKGLQAPAAKTETTATGEQKEAPKEAVKTGETAAQTQTPAPASNAAASTSGSQQQAPQSTGEGDEEDDLKMPSEIDMLKERAKLMGITFSNNIGVDALKEKIAAHRAAAEAKANPASAQEQPKTGAQTTSQASNGDGSVNALTGNETKPVRAKSLRQHLRDEKMKLIRVRITNLDPKKKDLPGEIITVANEYLGTVRKFVPFGEVTDNGFHVPQCIYDMLKERTFVSIKTRKDAKGQTIVEHQNAREFALEVLPQLTPEELAQLSAAQAAAGGL